MPPESSTSSELPALLETKHVMLALGWPRWRVIHWMRTTGAGELRGRRWFTTAERMLTHFPPAGQAVIQAQSQRAAEKRQNGALGAKSIESRLSLLTAKLESTTQRVRELEREAKKNRHEIRKMRRRLRNPRLSSSQSAPLTTTEEATSTGL